MNTKKKNKKKTKMNIRWRSDESGTVMVLRAKKITEENGLNYWLIECKWFSSTLDIYSIVDCLISLQICASFLTKHF